MDSSKRRGSPRTHKSCLQWILQKEGEPSNSQVLIAMDFPKRRGSPRTLGFNSLAHNFDHNKWGSLFLPLDCLGLRSQFFMDVFIVRDFRPEGSNIV
jgi:hypothetical protein